MFLFCFLTLYTLLNNLHNVFTLYWLANKLTYTIIQYYFKQRPPFNQLWGALNYNIYPAVLFTYILGPSLILCNVT